MLSSCGNSFRFTLPFERQEQGPDSEHAKHRKRPGAGPIDRPESRMLAWRKIEVDGFSEERVVGAEAMLARRHLPRHFLAIKQSGETFAVQGDLHLPILDITRVLARDRDSCNPGAHHASRLQSHRELAQYAR